MRWQCQALLTTAVAAQAKEREGVTSPTLLRASFPHSMTTGGETHCSKLLSGSSCVAQRSVPGPLLKRMRKVNSHCCSVHGGNLLVGAAQLSMAARKQRVVTELTALTSWLVWPVNQE